MKKLLTTLLIGTLITSPASSFANAASHAPTQTYLESSEVHILSETAPSVGSLLTRGKNPPSKSASVHNVATSGAYSYSVEKVGYAIYTNKWITGKTSYTVNVGDMKWVTKGDLDPKYSLTVTIYDGTGKKIESKTVNTLSSCTFSDLGKASNYYIEFAPRNDGTTWTFSGTIE